MNKSEMLLAAGAFASMLSGGPDRDVKQAAAAELAKGHKDAIVYQMEQPADHTLEDAGLIIADKVADENLTTEIATGDIESIGKKAAKGVAEVIKNRREAIENDEKKVNFNEPVSIANNGETMTIIDDRGTKIDVSRSVARTIMQNKLHLNDDEWRAVLEGTAKGQMVVGTVLNLQLGPAGIGPSIVRWLRTPGLPQNNFDNDPSRKPINQQELQNTEHFDKRDVFGLVDVDHLSTIDVVNSQIFTDVDSVGDRYIIFNDGRRPKRIKETAFAAQQDWLLKNHPDQLQRIMQAILPPEQQINKLGVGVDVPGVGGVSVGRAQVGERHSSEYNAGVAGIGMHVETAIGSNGEEKSAAFNYDNGVIRGGVQSSELVQPDGEKIVGSQIGIGNDTFSASAAEISTSDATYRQGELNVANIQYSVRQAIEPDQRITINELNDTNRGVNVITDERSVSRSGGQTTAEAPAAPEAPDTSGEVWVDPITYEVQIGRPPESKTMVTLEEAKNTQKRRVNALRSEISKADFEAFLNLYPIPQPPTSPDTSPEGRRLAALHELNSLRQYADNFESWFRKRQASREQATQQTADQQIADKWSTLTSADKMTILEDNKDMTDQGMIDDVIKRGLAQNISNDQNFTGGVLISPNSVEGQVAAKAMAKRAENGRANDDNIIEEKSPTYKQANKNKLKTSDPTVDARFRQTYQKTFGTPTAGGAVVHQENIPAALAQAEKAYAAAKAIEADGQLKVEEEFQKMVAANKAKNPNQTPEQVQAQFEELARQYGLE